MNIDVLTVFVAVAKAGSFAAAARLLGRDPSAVSRSVAQLERTLQTRLFQRTTRSLALTEAGREALERIEPITEELTLLTAAAADDHAEPSGRLVITTSVAFGQVCLMPLVPEFLARYPGITLDLQFTDRQLDLVADSVDIALRHGEHIDGSFVGRRLRDTNYRVCASPAWKRNHEIPAKPSAGLGQGAICMDLPGHRDRWNFRKGDGSRHSVPIKPRVLASGALTLRDAALAGLGPALLADWLAGDALASGELIDLYPRWDVSAGDFDAGLWVLYPSRKFLPRRTRLALDYFSGALC